MMIGLLKIVIFLTIHVKCAANIVAFLSASKAR